MATPIRDLWIGRLGLPTVEAPVGEQLGSEVTATGDSTAVGMRRVKGFTFNWPIHGTTGDANPYASGQRMRRQLRSAMQNSLYRLAGLYVMMTYDPERNGWMVIGTGTLEDADGGPTLAEYLLTINDAYRVAGQATHRDGFRVDLTDLRLTYSPVDYYGQVMGGTFAALTALALPALPVGGSDISVLEAPVLTFNRNSSDGPVPMAYLKTSPYTATQGALGSGDVLNWERDEPYFNRGDVVVYDRRGNITSYAPELAYQNLVPNPSLEYDTNAQAPALWSASAPAFWLNSGATLTATTGQAFQGTKAMQVVTTATTNEGATINITPIGGVPAGTVLTFSVWVKGNAGGETLNIAVGAASADSANSNITLTTSWQRFSVTWTATAYESAIYAVVRTASATARTFFVDGAIVAPGSTAPTYLDGDIAGGAWLGTAGQSPSILPPVVNLILNGNFQYDTPGGAPAGWLNTGSGGPAGFASVQVQQGLNPSQPPSYQSLVLGTGVIGSGAQCALLDATGRTVAGTSNSYPAYVGQQFVMQGQYVVQQTTGSVTIYMQANWYNASGTFISSTNSSNLASAAGSGQWSDVVTAPAAAAAVRFQVNVSASAANSSATVVLTKLMASNGATVPGYGDGDSLGWRWTGTYGNSVAVADVGDGQYQYGWEEAYGPDWPYSWLPPGAAMDAPVIANGICRVRFSPATGTAAASFKVDLWINGGYVEQGALVVSPFGGFLDSVLLEAAILEWTPERGAIEAILTNPSATGTQRERVVITLQRGWLGPRIECYTVYGATASITYTLPPGDRSDTVIKPETGALVEMSSLQLTGPGFATGQIGSSTFPADNWVSILRQGQPYQAHMAVVVQGSIYTANDIVYGYPASSNVVQFNSQTLSYASLHLSFSPVVSGQITEAEAIRNSGSGTTSTLSDVAALANPASAPTLATSTTGGSIPGPQTVWVKYTAYNQSGDTAPSAYASIAVGSGTTNSVTVTMGSVTGATGYHVYSYTSNTIGPLYTGSSLTTSYTITAVPNSGYWVFGSNFSGQTSSGGQYVKETQTANTNPTITGTANLVNGAKYHVFARFRTDTGNTIVSFQAKIGANAGAVIANYNGWVWQNVDLGEIVAPSASPTIQVSTWVTSGGGASYLDRVEFYLVEDRALAAGGQYAGARDIGQLALYDQRVETRKVSRA